MIAYLHEQGIHTTMITGDAEKTGQAVAKQLGMDEVVGNVLPENKSMIVEELEKNTVQQLWLVTGLMMHQLLLKQTLVLQWVKELTLQLM